MGSTIVHKGVKLDNHVMLAHNTEIGENTVMAAQTGVAGSTTVGSNCVFAGQVGVAGHLKVADKTTATAKAGVIKDVRKSGQVVSGYYAFAHSEFMKAYVKFRAA